MYTIKDVDQYLAQFAPAVYQEDYDNVGLLVGDYQAKVQGILLCVDITEEVIQEAIDQKCNLIIAHHPIIFRGLKRLTGKDYVSRCVMAAIKNNINLYVVHTNLDNVGWGVNDELAKRLGLTPIHVLRNKPNTYREVIVTGVEKSLQQLLQSWRSIQDKASMPLPIVEEANRVALDGDLSENQEAQKLTFTFPVHLQNELLQGLHQIQKKDSGLHFHFLDVEMTQGELGAGMLGALPHSTDPSSFIQNVKSALELTHVRHNGFMERPIKKVAVCGGSGSFLIEQAIRQGADAFLTADLKYHDFFSAQNRILLLDVGHYESEVVVKMLLYSHLSKKFTNIAILNCSTVTNPVHYS